MLIYEVNIDLDRRILEEYRIWLSAHMQEMLGFHGFRSARLFEDRELEEEQLIRFCCLYEVASQEDLDDYLANHAARMRADGLQRFGERFSASRRILHEI